MGRDPESAGLTLLAVASRPWCRYAEALSLLGAEPLVVLKPRWAGTPLFQLVKWGCPRTRPSGFVRGKG